MAGSKRSIPSPLEWNVESFSSRNIDEGNLIAQSSYSSQRSDSSHPSSHEHDVRTYSTNGTLHSMPLLIPVHEHSNLSSLATSQRVPYPMSDLHQTIPVTSFGLPQSQFPDQDPMYSTTIQEYPPRQSSPYLPQSYNEIRPPEEGSSHLSPSSTYSPRDNSLASTETPVPYSSSPQNEEYFTYNIENTQQPSRHAGRRPRRSRKTSTPNSPYRKEFRHSAARSGYSQSVRPRKARNGWGGRVNRAAPVTTSESLPINYNDSSEFGTDPQLPADDTCREISFDKDKVYVEIVEQPQPKALRFRYICEGRSAGSIPGVSSTPENKTYPTIKIVNYKGPVLAVVSCVTVNVPHRPHPHNLVGKDGCEGGVCSAVIDSETMICSFSNLGIQCVKKRDVEKSLLKREEKNVDPFCTGFTHRNQPQNIDLNAVRLCFQVYIKDMKSGEHIPLPPVVSEPIYDKKATADLVINKLSDCSCSAYGGREIILLCDKVTKEDVQIRFFELVSGQVVWEDFGEFQASDVHKQVAIIFKTPKYKNLDIKNPINVFVQLCRPSDNCTSEPRPFLYYPLDTEQSYILKKLEEEKWYFATEELRDKLMTPNFYDESHSRIVQPTTSSSSKTSKPDDRDSSFDELKPLGQARKVFPIASTSMKPTTKSARTVTPLPELESLEQYTSSSLPRGRKYAKSRTQQFHPPPAYTIPTAGQSQDMLQQPQPHYEELSTLLPKSVSYSSCQTLDPTEVFTGSASVTQAMTSQEDILDLDSQHLVPSIDSLPDLGLISTRDLYSSANSLTNLALSGAVSQSEAQVTAGLGSYMSDIQSGQISLNMPLISNDDRKSFDEEESCSSTSESFKKLKLDLEALNKLSR